MAKGKKTGGRQRGSLNKVTICLKDAAQLFTQDALGVLQSIMLDVKAPPAARVAAANAVLDRGHGKAPQALTGDGGGPVQIQTTVIHEHVSA